MVTVQRMFLRDLLPQYGIPSIAAFCQRLGLRKQYAWLLWHGTIALSADMMRRLHGELGIPLDALHAGGTGRSPPSGADGNPCARRRRATRRPRRRRTHDHPHL